MATKKIDTTAAPIVDALDTAKKVKDNAADIGTAATIRAKYDAIVAHRATIDPAAVPADAPASTADRMKVYRLVLSAAATAHRSVVSDAAMKAEKVADDTRAEYLFKVASIYRAAVNYADVYNGGNDKAKKATRSALFTEWKNYLSFLSGDAVKASADDAVTLMKAALRTVKGGIEYAAYKKQDGTTGARMVKGAAASAAVSPTSFQKELERAAVDRLLGFDGIMSYNAAKDTAANNTALREKAVAPVVLEPAAAPIEQNATETTAA